MQNIDDVLLRKHCKEGAYVVTYFWVPHKKMKKIQKNTHKKIYSEGKKIRVRKGCWNYHKMARNWLRRFRNTRIEI
jgi:hypothetical protein